MLNTTNVNVNRDELCDFLRSKYCWGVFVVHESEEVPTGVNECVHSIWLSLSWGVSTFGTCTAFEFLLQERIALPLPFWQQNRQLLLRHDHHPTQVTIDNRNRTPPKSLPRNKPILQPHIIYLFWPHPFHNPILPSLILSLYKFQFILYIFE